MFDLTGQTALVTGASGGIGGAIARALHPQGAQVALAGTRGAALAALADELGERTHPLTADLADPAAPDRLLRDAEAAMGQVDILVNNAGITRDTLALRMRDEDWQAVIEVNLTPVATTDHTADEHLVETLRVFAGNIVAGTGFTIYGTNDAQAFGIDGTRIWGKWTVNWQWN